MNLFVLDSQLDFRVIRESEYNYLGQPHITRLQVINLGTLFSLILLVLLVAIAVVDMRTYTIPDIFVAALVLVGLAASFTGNSIPPLEAIAGAFAGLGLTFGVRAGYKYWRGFHGMGLGDVKLAAAGGIWVGVHAIPLVLLIAALAGIMAILVTTIFRPNTIGKHDRIAFGPWLGLGIGITWIFNLQPLAHLYLDSIWQ